MFNDTIERKKERNKNEGKEKFKKERKIVNNKE
jgi:hypothetical protein